jgi:hypothetical protein
VFVEALTPAVLRAPRGGARATRARVSAITVSVSGRRQQRRCKHSFRSRPAR